MLGHVDWPVVAVSVCVRNNTMQVDLSDVGEVKDRST